MPRLRRTSLKTPFDWRITIQALVRTSNDVQNGSSTRIISRLLKRSGKLARKYASG
ncbi:hypothetical protein D9M73_267840 [compost metagenome]